MSVAQAHANRFSWSRDGLLLALLLALVLPIRGWLLYNTEVTARDSIGYIRYALDLERHGWHWSLLHHHQHPGYSACILAFSVPIRWWSGTGPDIYNMQLSAQLATSLAALFLIVPMYLTGKLLFDRQVAFWATLLLQYLPISGHHLADGISEGVFLLLVCSALYFGLIGIRQQAARHLAWCGVGAGLAYLTRPEGALIVIAAVSVLGLRQFSSCTRVSSKRLAGLTLSLIGPALLVGSAYFGVTHTFTRKPSTHLILSTAERTIPPSFAGNGPLWASCFGAHLRPSDSTAQRLGQGCAILTMELLQIFHYWGMAPLLLGALWHGKRLCKCSAFWLLLVYIGLQGAVVLALAAKAGYISDRHLMPIALVATYFLAAGLRDLPTHLREWLKWPAQHPATPYWKTPAAGGVIMLTLFLLSCLPQSVQRLHGNRLGNHLAGLWLAGKLTVGDIVEDDHCWSHYYSGRVFQEHLIPVLGKDEQPWSYVVITRSRDKHVAQQRDEMEERLKAENGQIVFAWPEDVRQERARVVVYQLPRSFERNPWHKASD